MQINPYLHFSGNCETAFKFYEKALGAKIQVLMTHEAAPADMPIPPEWAKKIMHGSILVDGEAILGADAPPQRYHKPQGFAITLTVPDPADAERKFKALAEGGSGTCSSRRPSLPRVSECASIGSTFPGW